MPSLAKDGMASLQTSRWNWSDPVVISIPSRATQLRAARRRQAALVRAWARERAQTLPRIEQLLAESEAHAPDSERQAEQIRTTAPLGQLLHPAAGLGRSLRSPHIQVSPEELHARYLLVGQANASQRAASAAPSSRS